jgi:hypothetical protein
MQTIILSIMKKTNREMMNRIVNDERIATQLSMLWKTKAGITK